MSDQDILKAELIAALALAETVMSIDGTVEPQVRIIGADGSEHICLCRMPHDGPSGTFHEASKDILAHHFRMAALKCRAKSVSLLSECWQSNLRAWGGRPSEDPNRREMVALQVESQSGYARAYAPILRDSHGNFARFGPLDFAEIAPGKRMASGDRFGGLLPPPDAYLRPDLMEAVNDYFARGAAD